jgi:hypothetical protein
MKPPKNPLKKGHTSNRKQVREAISPHVNVPRESKRPVERSKQHRSRSRGS